MTANLFPHPKRFGKVRPAPPPPDPMAEARAADRLALGELRREIAESSSFRMFRDDAGNELGSFPSHWTLPTVVRFNRLKATVATYEAHGL